MRRLITRVALCAVAASLLMALPVEAKVCEHPIKHKVLFEASTFSNFSPQVLVATNEEQLKRILNALDIEIPTISREDRLRKDVKIDFAHINVLVAIGHPRTNGCRKTRFLCVQRGDHWGDAQATIAEVYPGCGCICTDVFQGSAVFFVAVPRGVTQAELLTLRRRFNCSPCDPHPCPLLDSQPNDQGLVIVEPICRR